MCLRVDLQETLEFINDYYDTWVIKDDVVLLKQNSQTRNSEKINSFTLISDNLAYATELERIV